MPDALDWNRSSDGALAHFSVSAMKQYHTCSLQYFFARVLKLPRPSSPALHVGKAVHEGLRAFNVALWRGEDASPEAVFKAYQTGWDTLEAESPVNWESEDERDKHQACGARVLTAYLESDMAQLTDKPLGVELKLEAYEHPLVDSPLVGIVDLIRGDGTVVDYKTCAATPDLALEAFLHEAQMTCYGLLYQESAGTPVKGLELIYLVKTKSPKIIRQSFDAPTEAHKQRFFGMLESYADGVYHERFYPQPGQQCRFCQFRQECAQWKGQTL